VLECCVGETPPDTAALAQVMRELRRVFDRYGNADDIVQDPMVHLMQSGGRAAAPEIRSAWAYLRTIAENQRVDAYRRGKRQVAVTPLIDLNAESIRDDVARLLDRNASQTTVIRALAHHRHLGDVLTLRVITEWLNLAEQLEKLPSNRAVAERAGTTHPTVRARLDDFKETLQALDADEI
jgi:DNA-directed RNA polymerase specialized sigma24 family protein